MGGKAFQAPFKSVEKVFSNPGKANISDYGALFSPSTRATEAWANHEGEDQSNPQLATEDSKKMLAQSGGAPLLANVAMGVDPKAAIAGYFGESNFDEWYNGTPSVKGEAVDGHFAKVTPGRAGLSDMDKKLVDGVLNQLTTIQKNSAMRNEAVQKVVNDFPNIAAQAAQARKASGEEFDTVTKGYMDQALQGTAAKYAAGGNISSGAMNEATAKVGAAGGYDKLNYMDSRESNAYNQGLQGWQARYNETNALRNFQNLMTQGAAGNGFSAAQSSLQRNQQTNLANLGLTQQAQMQAQAQDNAMMGALGSVAGTVVGGYFGGPAGAAGGGQVGGQAANMMTSSGNPRLNLTQNQPRYF